MAAEADKASSPSGAPTADDGAPVRRWTVVELLGAAREAAIDHGGEVYRLRLTANNKLILTK